MAISNYNLLIGLKEGNQQTFEELYRKYYHRIFSFANSYVRDSYIAGNLTQDAFMILWEKREELAEDTHIPAFLLTIVKNKALTHLNRLKTKAKAKHIIQVHYLHELELRCATLDACNPELLFHADVESIIQQTIESLPERCRQVFQLSRFEGLSNKDIADHLRISIKGVEFHITKALKCLKENLRDYLIYLVLFLTDFFS